MVQLWEAMNAANDFPGSVSARLGENGAAAGLDGGRVAAPTDLGIDPPDGLQDRAALIPQNAHE